MELGEGELSNVQNEHGSFFDEVELHVKVFSLKKFYVVDFVKAKGNAASFNKAVENLVNANEVKALKGVTS